MSFCVYGGTRKPGAPELFVIDDNPLCFLFGADGVLCKASKILVAIAQTKKPLKALIRESLISVYSSIMNGDLVFTNLFCEQMPPSSLPEITYADVVTFFASLADPTGLINSDLAQKVRLYWQYQKWFELCECQKSQPNPWLPPDDQGPFPPTPPCPKCYGRKMPNIAVFRYDPNHSLIDLVGMYEDTDYPKWPALVFINGAYQQIGWHRVLPPSERYQIWLNPAGYLGKVMGETTNFGFAGYRLSQGFIRSVSSFATYIGTSRTWFYRGPGDIAFEYRPGDIWVDWATKMPISPDQIGAPKCTKTLFTGECSDPQPQPQPAENIGLKELCEKFPDLPICKKNGCCCGCNDKEVSNSVLWLPASNF